MSNVAEWTVMVFLNGDNNLEPFALEDFNEMATVGSSDQVNIILQFDRNSGHSTASQNWSQCLRFKVERDMEPLPQNALQDLGEVNMGDGLRLAEFVQWAMSNYPARKYMLEIWDHGQGWRFFETMPVRGTVNEIRKYHEFRRETLNVERNFRSELVLSDGDNDKNTENIQMIPTGRVIESPFRYISSDDTSNDHLFNREIQDCLINILEGRKIDLIGFDACLMAMVEMGFAMRNIADVMVGSEELEPGAGWNYSDWLRVLVENPTMNSDELGRLLVDSYRRSYQYDNTVTLSAIKLSQMNNLADAIDTLANDMIAKVNVELVNIQQSRNNCAEYAPGYGLHGIDLTRFCEQLKAATSDTSLRNNAQEVINAVSSSVINNFAALGRQGRYGSHGLAIYFPRNRGLFNTDPDRQGYLQNNTYYPVEFVQLHRWDDFLRVFYQLVP